MAYPDDFIPEIWSARVLDTLDKNLVFPMLTRNDYQGEVASAGDTVRIQKFTNVSAGAYSGSVTYATPRLDDREPEHQSGLLRRGEHRQPR